MEYSFFGIGININNGGQRHARPTLIHINGGDDDQQTGKPMWLFDLDGTIGNHDHRVHLVVNKAQDPNFKKDYKAYYEAAEKDSPNPKIVDMIKKVRSAGFDIAIATGRPDIYVMQTVRQLQRFGILEDISFMMMRDEEDFRPNAEFKLDCMALASETNELTGLVDDMKSSRDAAVQAGLRAIDPNSEYI